MFFFFKQKTAYEMRISDWSSDVCSSDLTPSLAVVASGNARAEQWGEPSRLLDFHDLKGDLDTLIAWGGEPERWSIHADELPSWLHPGRGARVARDGETVGYLGALHPRLARELDLEIGRAHV